MKKRTESERRGFLMNKQDWQSIWRVSLGFARQNKKTIFSFFISVILEAINPFITVILTGKLLDAVQRKEETEKLFWLIFAAFGIQVMLRIIGCRTREWYNQKLEYMKEIEAYRLNEKSFLMDYEYLEDIKVQELRVRGVSKTYLGVVGQTFYFLEDVIKNGVSIGIAIGILIPMFVKKNQIEYGWIGSIWFSLFLWMGIGVLIWINYKSDLFYAEQEMKAYNNISGEENQMNYYMDMLADVESQKDLRNYGQQKIIETEVEKLCEKGKDGIRQVGKSIRKKLWIGNTISNLSGLLIYLFTGFRAYVGMISIGQVVTYAASMIQFSKSVSEFARAMGGMKEAALACKDYIDYIDLSKRKYEGTIPVEKRRDHRFLVEFEQVSFRYPGTQTDVIRNLNLKFVIGEKMAIVGKNGSGKTTFIKLLCRLYDVTEGCIKVNGIDIRKYNYAEYQKLFAVVFQDFRLFAFSVGENVAASKQVEVSRAMDALGRAGLEERMEKLRDGLDTFVGKEVYADGVVFSGGEKQKMAIARAIYKDASFVIMDEPTAALDPISECEVYAGFDQMVGKKTALYISHRLASCRFCEDILVFDQGTVVQRGSHEELVKEDGIYRKLWNAQAQYYC